MLTITELRQSARARLNDARILMREGSYDGAAYLCGYAVEIALKARISKSLRWTGFPHAPGEFSGLQSFRTHDLEILLRLSAWESRVRTRYNVEWSIMKQWRPEARYNPPGQIAPPDARQMYESAKALTKVLL